MPERAILFDFDGVIADTENHHVASWQRTFGTLGWVVSEEVCARAMEQDDREFLKEVFAARSLEGGDVEGWVRRKQELTRAMLADAPQVYPGVVALVERLTSLDFKLAVVTGTWRENVESVLDACGIRDAFSTVVGKDDVTLTKPDPECYGRVLKALKVKPANAWAIEDSPSGLAAARGAGVNLLAVGHRRPEGEWVGDATFLKDLRDADAVLAVLGIKPRSQ